MFLFDLFFFFGDVIPTLPRSYYLELQYLIYRWFRDV